jgi:hypothetical protein
MSARWLSSTVCKRHVVGESLVRRNPFYYERSRRCWIARELDCEAAARGRASSWRAR